VSIKYCRLLIPPTPTALLSPSSLRVHQVRLGRPRALSDGAAGLRWQREGAGVVDRFRFRYLGGLPVVWIRARDLWGQIWCIRVWWSCLVELRRPEKASSSTSEISVNKILFCCFWIRCAPLHSFGRPWRRGEEEASG
jgi:hypothetical protein